MNGLRIASVIFAAAWALSTGAASAADRVPAMELPALTGGGSVRFPDAFAGAEHTVLIVWSRGCPHCRELAFEADELAPFLAERDAGLVSVLCGPDDPVALETMLDDERVATPQFWDATGRTARGMGLGGDHFGAFLVDRSGAVRAAFDDSIDDLAGAIVPALDALRAEDVAEEPAGGPDAAPGGAALPIDGRIAGSPPAAGLPTVTIDARLRLESTEGAERDAAGLYGQRIENGALALHRVDVRLAWDLGHGFELVPWIRTSNEDEEALVGGAEQMASRHGSLSLHWRGRAASATLGAYALRLSPLLLQRWDEEDAPPLGGVGGCSTCAGGVAGLVQRSLEILDASYTFEGATAAFSRRWARVRASVAIPRWERREERFAGVSVSDSLAARYRRTLVAASVDVGPAGSEAPASGLPTPIGARLAWLSIGDDRRSVDETTFIRPPRERDERAWLIMAQAGPWRGLSLEGEYVGWRRVLVEGQRIWDERLVDLWTLSSLDRGSHRIGLRGAWRAGRIGTWARAHHLRVDEGFEPDYAALTVEPNEQGWRAAGGIRLFDGAATFPERVELSGFLRTVEETRSRNPVYGRFSRAVWSLSLTGRPGRDLTAGLHLVRVTADSPAPMLPDESRTGVSLTVRWEGIRGLDPTVRADLVRTDDGVGDATTYRQVHVAARVRM